MSQNIILAVIDPTRENQIALTKAAQIANTIKARIHAFCCCYLDTEAMGKFNSRADAKHDTLKHMHKRIESLVEPIRAAQIAVDIEVFWNERWYESVIHACSRVGADMVVKTSSPHSSLSRKLSSTSDYILLRNAPCPVLLVTSDEPWHNSRILAAITLERADPEHELLNNAIMTAAQRLATQTELEVHIVTAMPEVANLSEILSLLEEEGSAKDKESLIASRFGVPRQQVHIGAGPAKKVIPKTVAAVQPDVLIMGTLARKGLQGALLGNTAEKILDAVDIDILCVN